MTPWLKNTVVLKKAAVVKDGPPLVMCKKSKADTGLAARMDAIFDGVSELQVAPDADPSEFESEPSSTPEVKAALSSGIELSGAGPKPYAEEKYAPWKKSQKFQIIIRDLAAVYASVLSVHTVSQILEGVSSELKNAENKARFDRLEKEDGDELDQLMED